MPFIRFALRHKVLSIGIAVALLAITIIPWTKIGSEFMPPLREGDILFMPTTVPGISVTEARRTLQMQDALLAQFPEVKVVLGKIGRSTTPTDPAPLAMVETHASLRPEEDWPRRLIEKGYLKPLAYLRAQTIRKAPFLWVLPRFGLLEGDIIYALPLRYLSTRTMSKRPLYMQVLAALTTALATPFFVMAGLVPAIHVLVVQRLVEVVPLGIVGEDQAHFPGTRPMLHVLLALNGLTDGGVVLAPNKPL